jgi:anti-anti-sigma factor
VPFGFDTHTDMDLELTRHEIDGVAVVTVRGALDLTSGTALENVLRGALAARVPVIVDVCGVQVIDSTGLRVLLDARSAQSRRSLEFALSCDPDGNVARMLGVAGAARFLRIFETTDEAVEALRPRR